jgi:hypothetical protein
MTNKVLTRRTFIEDMLSLCIAGPAILKVSAGRGMNQEAFSPI